MDIALHRRFSENRLVYFTYTRRSGTAGLNLARGLLRAARSPRSAICWRRAYDGNLANAACLRSRRTIGLFNGGNIANADSQTRGKILRLGDDGTVPLTTCRGQADKPYIYS
jgi:glucose/arabinose dehydrogenase